MHEGFAWALDHSCGSKKPQNMSLSQWQTVKAETPVRIQWDPERNLTHDALDHRSIQIGLTGIAVEKYTGDWIARIHEVTDLAHRIHALVDRDKLHEAAKLCPQERPYTLYGRVDHLGS